MFGDPFEFYALGREVIVDDTKYMLIKKIDKKLAFAVKKQEDGSVLNGSPVVLIKIPSKED